MPATFTHPGSTITETASITRKSDVHVSQPKLGSPLSTDGAFNASIPAPTSSPPSKPEHPKKVPAHFAIDGYLYSDDDDDSPDWEDSIEDSGTSSVDEKFFQRVEYKGKLACRPSLITLMLAQDERARTLGSTTLQSTSAISSPPTTSNGIALGGSSNDSDEEPLMMQGTRSSAQPIATGTTHIHAQAALSPGTTRRHMLATELTESLRRHLLWERQQKTSTANAVLKRRHTSHDVACLQQFPEKHCMKQSEDVNASSWNHYICRETLNGYHSKGW